jgi:sugar phosphate isomerase/epimerase
MKIGVRHTNMTGEGGIEAAIQWTAENGFGAYDTPALNPEIRQAMDGSGLDLGTVDMGGPTVIVADEGKRKENIEKLKASMSRSAELGAKVLFTVFGPEDGTRPRRENFELWKLGYPEIVEHAEGLGLKIAIEPWPGGPPHYGMLGCTPEMWRAIFKEVPSKALGLCFDPSHLVRMQIDYVRALNEFGDRIYHVHAKDTEVNTERLYECGIYGDSVGNPGYGFGERWWRYCIPGTGDVDWNLVVARLEDFGYEGPLSIELEDQRFWNTPEAKQEGLLRAKAYLETLVR